MLRVPVHAMLAIILQHLGAAFCDSHFNGICVFGKI